MVVRDMSNNPLRIAMWSGPRNLSTAMMYAFAQRSDTSVVDEPFYAAYLSATGLTHPMTEEILAAQPVDPAEVSAACLGPVPEGCGVFYQKQMAHHMVDGFPLDWLQGVRNVFLIRHPARVVASYARKREDPTLEDIGFIQQAALYDHVKAMGQNPIVIDSFDIRQDPERLLGLLCAELGLTFDPAMLHWAPGGRPEDGVWASHWYGAVHRSTGFEGAEGPLPTLTDTYAEVAEAALPFYLRLRSEALGQASSSATVNGQTSPA